MRLLLLQAKWAFMKTRRMAIALEKGRVGERRAQAEGWVSRIMVRREGGGSEGDVRIDFCSVGFAGKD